MRCPILKSSRKQFDNTKVLSYDSSEATWQEHISNSLFSSVVVWICASSGTCIVAHASMQLYRFRSHIRYKKKKNDINRKKKCPKTLKGMNDCKWSNFYNPIWRVEQIITNSLPLHVSLEHHTPTFTKYHTMIKLKLNNLQRINKNRRHESNGFVSLTKTSWGSWCSHVRTVSEIGTKNSSDCWKTWALQLVILRAPTKMKGEVAKCTKGGCEMSMVDFCWTPKKMEEVFDFQAITKVLNSESAATK